MKPIGCAFWRVLLLGMAAFSTPAFSAQQEFDAAKNSNAFLDIGAGARAVGMGEAFTGVSGDVTSLYWNPAGLGRLSNPQFSFMHNQWFQNTAYEYGAIGVPLGSGAALAGSLTYMNYGALEGFDTAGQTTGSFSAYDMNLTLGLGVELAPGFRGGAALNLPMSVVNNESLSSMAFDLGAQLDIPGARGLTAGLALKNLGGSVGNGSQPSQIKFGLGWSQVVEGLAFGLDVGKHFNESAMQISAGAEYCVEQTLSLRAGYKTFSEESGLGSGLAGLTLGVGLNLGLDALGLKIDYAFSPYGELGSTHRIGFVADLGGAPKHAAATASMWNTPAAKPAPAASNITPPAFLPSTGAALEAPAAPSEAEPEYQAVPAPQTPAFEPPARLPNPKKVTLKKLKNGAVKLTWNSADPASRYNRYNIYMKHGSKIFKLNRKPVAKTSFTTRKLPRKAAYQFVVKTVGDQGMESSGSQPVSLRFK